MTDETGDVLERVRRRRQLCVFPLSSHGIWEILSPDHIMGQTGKQDLLQGTLGILVLKALSRQEMHGYAVAEWILSTSSDVLEIEEGALYPALHRLETRGLLASRWGRSENNRRAKFYRLTRLGQRRLREETASWRRTRTAIDQILDSI